MAKHHHITAEQSDPQSNSEHGLAAPITRRKFLALGGMLGAGLAARSILKGDAGWTTALAPATGSGAASGKAIARRLLDAYNSGDVQAVNRLIHPSLAAQTARLTQDLAQLRAAFPDARFAVDELMADGDTVIMRWTMTGTNRGPWLGRAATGKQVRVVGHEVLRVAGGQIVAHDNGLTNARPVMLRQLGWLNATLLRQLA